MNKDQATPRPWRLGQGNQHTDIVVGNEDLIVSVYSSGIERNIKEEIANARLIVKAVNEYDILVSLLIKAQGALSCTENELTDEIKQALAKAGEA